MPTASRLVAALCFGLVGWGVAGVMIFRLVAVSELERDREILITFAIIGVLFGWRILGRNAGHGIGSSVYYALRTGGFAYVFTLFAFSLHYLYRRMQVNAYREPMEALTAGVKQMSEYAMLTLDPAIWSAAIVGCMLAGILTEFADRVWR